MARCAFSVLGKGATTHPTLLIYFLSASLIYCSRLFLFLFGHTFYGMFVAVFFSFPIFFLVFRSHFLFSLFSLRGSCTFNAFWLFHSVIVFFDRGYGWIQVAQWTNGKMDTDKKKTPKYIWNNYKAVQWMCALRSKIGNRKFTLSFHDCLLFDSIYFYLVRIKENHELLSFHFAYMVASCKGGYITRAA